MRKYRIKRKRKIERGFSTVIYLNSFLSKNLLLRKTADTLFEYINQCKGGEVYVDFGGIESITGAFADQYILNKEKSYKLVISKNMGLNIVRMFIIVKNRRNERYDKSISNNEHR